MKNSRLAFVVTCVAIAACNESPTATPVPEFANRAPVEIPMTETFNDLNPCTGQNVTYTFTGTARIQTFGDHSTLVGKGTVETSDGFRGTFNRTFIFNGNVTHLRFHDSEMSDPTGQKIMFGVGLFHETDVNGVPVVSFEQFSGLRCIGR